MQLVDVRIKNYKCILDSETFTVDQMTCLVGKNESGKSAILQALYKLNPVDKEDIYDALYEYPKMYKLDTFSEKYLLKYLPKFSYFAEYQKLPGKIAINRFISRSNSGQLTKNEKVFERFASIIIDQACI